MEDIEALEGFIDTSNYAMLETVVVTITSDNMVDIICRTTSRKAFLLAPKV